MNKSIEEFLIKCVFCQHSKMNIHTRSLIQYLESLSSHFQIVCILSNCQDSDTLGKGTGSPIPKGNKG